MSGNDLETLLAGMLSGAGRSLAEELSRVAGVTAEAWRPGADQLATYLGEFRVLQQGQGTAVAANTRAVLQSTAAQVSSGSGSTLASVGQAVWSKLGAGLTLSPLITGLVRLFGGGSPEPPPALVAYAKPAALEFEGAVARSWGPQVYPLGYDQYGRPRAMEGEIEREGEATVGTRPQITIQVQAIDSRSFLEHSAEIAQAVREAMLNSHALNDVVSEV